MESKRKRYSFSLPRAVGNAFAKANPSEKLYSSVAPTRSPKQGPSNSNHHHGQETEAHVVIKPTASPTRSRGHSATKTSKKSSSPLKSDTAKRRNNLSMDSGKPSPKAPNVGLPKSSTVTTFKPRPVPSGVGQIPKYKPKRASLVLPQDSLVHSLRQMRRVSLEASNIEDVFTSNMSAHSPSINGRPISPLPKRAALRALPVVINSPSPSVKSTLADSNLRNNTPSTSRLPFASRSGSPRKYVGRRSATGAVESLFSSPIEPPGAISQHASSQSITIMDDSEERDVSFLLASVASPTQPTPFLPRFKQRIQETSTDSQETLIHNIGNRLPTITHVSDDSYSFSTPSSRRHPFSTKLGTDATPSLAETLRTPNADNLLLATMAPFGTTPGSDQELLLSPPLQLAIDLDADQPLIHNVKLGSAPLSPASSLELSRSATPITTQPEEAVEYHSVIPTRLATATQSADPTKEHQLKLDALNSKISTLEKKLEEVSIERSSESVFYKSRIASLEAEIASQSLKHMCSTDAQTYRKLIASDAWGTVLKIAEFEAEDINFQRKVLSNLLTSLELLKGPLNVV